MRRRCASRPIGCAVLAKGGHADGRRDRRPCWSRPGQIAPLARPSGSTPPHPRHRLHAGQRDRHRARRGPAASSEAFEQARALRPGRDPGGAGLRRRATGRSGTCARGRPIRRCRTYPQERSSEIPAFAGMTRRGIPRLARMARPCFKLEKIHPDPVAGVDEAGCAPLAGPVVAAAVVLDRNRFPRGIDDSKALPARDARGDLRAALQGRGGRRRHRQRRGDRHASTSTGRGCWR